ncbi:SpoIIE family protein phosphatase [Streptomyces mexicanus]|uniref:SpoIIE family protein phosphatase n=1 Tax=Streptomyces mexicanus TaxID=178566 RepID=UPI003659790A
MPGGSRPSGHTSRRGRRSGWWSAPRTVAGQVLVLQLVLVVVLISLGTLFAALQSRNQAMEEARTRTLVAAETLAGAPGTAQAVTGPDPTAVLQPRAESLRRSTGVDLIVVYSPTGIRYTHPDPRLIGRRVPHPTPIPATHSTEVIDTTAGASVTSVVPVRSADGSVVGAVAVAVAVRGVQHVLERQLPVLIGVAAGALVFAVGTTTLFSRRLRRQTHGLGPAEMTRMYEHHDAVLHSVREGVLIIGADGRLLLANDEARRLLSLTGPAEGRAVTALGLDPAVTELLLSGHAVTDTVQLAGDRLLAVNTRVTTPPGGPSSTVATLRDTTELGELAGRADTARRRLGLLYDAGVGLGTSLDVVRTAQQLVRVAVPRFADLATVSLPDEVVRGEEPPPDAAMRRVAVADARNDPPLLPVGELTRPPGPAATDPVAPAPSVLSAGPGAAPDAGAADPREARRLREGGIRSAARVPLRARGAVIGVVGFYRAGRSPAFEPEDVAFAEELAARAALAIDNARRYTHEHHTAVSLQRSLLPAALAETTGVEAAHRYLPARAGVGGDWFDVIPLSGARTALVVGDVVGHGLHAAATMGRLRTAVHNFSSLDLPPEELLSGVDELVHRIDEDPATQGERPEVTGATCLYAVYDPVSGRATIARAGHPGPALVGPDGHVTFPDVPASPPLGVGGHPFETAELRVPEGSRLLLFTDGLVQNREMDIDSGLTLLRRTLGEAGDLTPEETCRVLVDTLVSDRTRDDVSLLVVRTGRLAPERVAEWEVPSDPAAVSAVRAACGRRLREWGLDEVAFATELVLSELLTNAIRHGSPPVRVRLLRDHCLICEVFDGSSTAPHLRRAAITDEGGRGLFLVAQFTDRWGTRYTGEGKVIWTEQSLRGGSATGPEEYGEEVLLGAWEDDWDRFDR